MTIKRKILIAEFLSC